MKNEQLSANIWLSELCKSQLAMRMGRVVVPTEQELANLRRLAITVLQPLRDYFGKPLVISSGLRPPWLNQAARGAEDSDHIYGCAADFEILGVANLAVCHAVRKCELPIDQCILEHPPDGWVHASIERPGTQPRGAFLTARLLQGKTVYAPGING